LNLIIRSYFLIGVIVNHTRVREKESYYYKRRIVGAIHELPLRDTTHMFHFLPLTFSQTIDTPLDRDIIYKYNYY